MLTFSQALILGLIQGITELFPVSSLGHSVLLPSLLGWHIDQNDPYFVSFLVLTHLATALVLLAFFWADWIRIIGGIFRSLSTRTISNDPSARLGWLLILGTVPAGLIGLLLQKKFEALFAAPTIVAVFLIGNGVLLFGAETLSRRRAKVEAGSDNRLARLSWTQSLGIGLMQCLALLPGFSRTGATITGGLLSGLSHLDAARFSFLLATPIILAAAVLKVPHLAFVGGQGIEIALVGAIASAFSAYLAVRYLGRYFKTKTLTPFAVYCILLGILSLFLLS
jgi:undecaprenyl-diphosphatase